MSERTVRRYVELYYSTGDVECKKQTTGPTCLLNDFEQITVLQSQAYCQAQHLPL